jgi:hypothetical protein
MSSKSQITEQRSGPSLSRDRRRPHPEAWARRAAGPITAFSGVLLAGSLFAGLVKAQQAPGNPPRAADATQPAAGAQHSRYQPDRFAGRAGAYYRLVWGVESLGVKWAESGEVIRFSYRVLDPEKAKTLNEKRYEPSLIDPQAGVQLVVPSMEKIGQLRQTSTPEAGKSYWMAFSNKGRLVKRGHRVSVVIGKFRADGLVVD